MSEVMHLGANLLKSIISSEASHFLLHTYLSEVLVFMIILKNYIQKNIFLSTFSSTQSCFVSITPNFIVC